jgi:chloride channel 7
MVIAIGVCTGSVAFLLGVVIEWLAKLRWGVSYYLMENDMPAASFFYFASLAVIYIGISSYFTSFHAPTAAGSGIPEVKSYLNGVNLRNILSTKTLLVKICGVALSFTGGLAIGKEGPLVQTGSAISMMIL